MDLSIYIIFSFFGIIFSANIFPAEYFRHFFEIVRAEICVEKSEDLSISCNFVVIMVSRTGSQHFFKSKVA